MSRKQTPFSFIVNTYTFILFVMNIIQSILICIHLDNNNFKISFDEETFDYVIPNLKLNSQSYDLIR